MAAAARGLASGYPRRPAPALVAFAARWGYPSGLFVLRALWGALLHVHHPAPNPRAVSARAPKKPLRAVGVFRSQDARRICALKSPASGLFGLLV